MNANARYGGCNACSAVNYEVMRPYPGWEGIDLVTCRECRLMQAQPVPSDEFLWNFYQSNFGHDPVMGHQMTSKSERGFRRRGELQLDFVKKLLGNEFEARGPEQRSILDVGCHAASFLSLFKDRGWSVTGLDPNPRSEYGEKWYGIPVIQKLFEKNLFAADTFDAILHSHALEHVPDPRGYIEEFFRLLKPGGWVFIEVPNESVEKVMTGKIRPHLYFFTPKTLERMSREAGFEVLATRVLSLSRYRRNFISKEGLEWLKLRWRARFDARGRANLLSFMPLFCKLFKQDRYFKDYEPRAEMLRVFLRKPLGASGHRENAGSAQIAGPRKNSN